jgi:hypothetical protein
MLKQPRNLSPTAAWVHEAANPRMTLDVKNTIQTHFESTYQMSDAFEAFPAHTGSMVQLGLPE